MADIKQMSFMLLVLLVSVSALYETMQSEDDAGTKVFPAVANDLGITPIDDFSSTTLVNDLNGFQIATNKIFTTSPVTEFFAFIAALSNAFESVWKIFMKLMFGWIDLVTAIFAAVGLPGLDAIFIAPLTIIQIIASFYFLRDLVNAIRGVGSS